ncbi:hypothetical protein K3495_g4474 [Podosphaera aphanis]|nr:hypothetical protein K3495_g4474 [Podosphaera aphanis]
MEAEYIALFETSKHAIWVKRFFNELKVTDQLIGNNGILVLTDNQSALSLVEGINSAKAKHIDAAYHFTRDCVIDGDIRVKFIPSEKMLTDILTKPLPHSRVKLLCQQIFQSKKSSILTSLVRRSVGIQGPCYFGLLPLFPRGFPDRDQCQDIVG